MSVGVMKDYILKLRNLLVTHTLGWSWNWNIKARVKDKTYLYMSVGTMKD
jgi:hypothetical protein